MNWSSFLILTIAFWGLSGAYSTSETERPKNRIVFHETNLTRAVALELLNSDKDHYEILSIGDQETNNITSYLCNLPQQEQFEVNFHEPRTTLHDLKEQAVELIADTFDQDKCLYAFGILGNYWTIGFCYGDKVMQFHEDIEDFLKASHKPNHPNHVYMLGRFPGSEKFNLKETRISNQAIGQPKLKLDPREFSVDEGYSHKLEGEICDLTGQPRKLTVKYVCDSSNSRIEVLEIREIKTCQYDMVLNIPSLCKLNVAKEHVVDILCTQIFA
ncbi:Protein OS-9 [Candida viswanathii]|uniref:Endoplasmic reticulum lectin n=1 Tax=Candida viswanathii TaxID=5486 RepID=A0A367YJG7_9ASCO|nr:Protein OS-9 [Candida viswanathii]